MVKEKCQHGGTAFPDECFKSILGKRNEPKLFVGTQDEALRNELRNTGTVPIFFF